MKSLVSINYKFMDINPKELVELIKTSKYIKGVEACINLDSPFELKYLEDLVFELNRNDLILQIHGEIEFDLDKQLNYIKKLEEYSDLLGYKIVLTFHTIYDEDKEISIKKTLDYISNIKSDKVIICLENLNDIRGFVRIGKDEIKNTILNDEQIYFTYDICHELFDNGNIIGLDKYLLEDIRNVHIHSNNKGDDHKPIYKNDIHWDELMKALEFLLVNKYEYNIVYEYNLYECSGETTLDKIKNFFNSVDLVSEKYM